MFKSLYAPLAAGVLFSSLAIPAFAAESTVDMVALRAKGPGPAIGTIAIADSSEGAVLQFKLTDIPPGPNRVYLHDAGSCALPRSELMATPLEVVPLTVVNVSTNDDGALPLRAKVLVPNVTLAELSGKALVIHRGGQTASAAKEQVGAPLVVACGVVN